jgi:hypothetical protein
MEIPLEEANRLATKRSFHFSDVTMGKEDLNTPIPVVLLFPKILRETIYDRWDWTLLCADMADNTSRNPGSIKWEGLSDSGWRSKSGAGPIPIPLSAMNA